MDHRIERILKACRERNISLTKLVLQSGYTRGNATRIKKGLPVSERFIQAMEGILFAENPNEVREDKSIYEEKPDFEKWCLEFKEKWNQPNYAFRGAYKDLMRATFRPDTFGKIMEWLEKKDHASGGGHSHALRVAKG
jgi:hypothetical protein